MHFHNPHVLAEQSRQHRAELAQQAHAHRLARGMPRTQPPAGRRLLAALGARLVHWGTRLHEINDALQVMRHESRVMRHES